MSRECVVCTEPDSEDKPLLELPCFNHWVCQDCITDYFINATNNESLFPPRCCDEPIPMEKFEKHIPGDVQLAYYQKEQGEYTILPKFRVYCASSVCGKFIHPSGHIKHGDSNITYAVCDSADCSKTTCCACKMLIIDGVQGHVCQVKDNDKKFKEAVVKNGYKECSVCGMTVELAEACNHITCECGNDFCYICGKQWTGIHGCPHYGPAIYDAEGYNQAGYHRDTGLNRDGRTHGEEMIHRGAQGTEDDDENDDDEDDDGNENVHPGVENVWNQVMGRLGPDQRAMIEGLDEDTREEALMQIMDEWVTQGVVLDLQPIVEPQEPQEPEEGGEDEDDGDDDGGHDDDGGENAPAVGADVGENANQNEGQDNTEDGEHDENPEVGVNDP